MKCDFQKVFDYNVEMLYRIAILSLTEPDAEEVVADTFIAFWQHADIPKNNWNQYRSWLVAVLRNRIVSKIRYNRAAKRGFIVPHSWIEEDESLNYYEDPLSDTVDYLQEIKAALHILSSRERQIINYTMAGAFPAQIAIELQTSVQTIMNQKSTAIKKLRDHFHRNKRSL